MNEIRVYPLKQSFGWIIGKKKWRIERIQNNTNTNITIYNTYFSIKGSLINLHKTRIIIQDLEKTYHKNNITYA